MADTLARDGLYDQTAPRYTSYPPATAFHPGIGASHMAAWLAASVPDEPVSLYLHIPFCERLCWFCACRTQGTRSHAPVAAYLDTLIAEMGIVAELLPGRRRVARLHWGGGTPTILTPDQITRLTQALSRTFDLTAAEFSVEIDPTCVDEAKLDALVAAGISRASLGVQDFSPEVQAAIGRDQSFALTAGVVDALRARGVGSINADLVYGLPLQTPSHFAETMR
jgi:oxygen-independent coproporphyrinogen-3 oxidase